MNVLVTGADGFVGRHLVRHLRELGHAVRGGARVEGLARAGAEEPGVEWVPLELTDDGSVRSAVADDLNAIVHLAAVASNAEAARDPGRAWEVNAAGTARLAAAVAARWEQQGAGPRLLVVSSGEVYGRAEGPVRECDAVRPQSPYAASKAAAEIAALEIWRRTGAWVVIARPFTHSGPGQLPVYLIPSLIRRMLEARAAGRSTVAVGNLAPVRDVTDVRDVVRAYALLLERGVAGETYNVARGEGIGLRALFDRIRSMTGAAVEPVADPALLRRSDLPCLIGDSTRVRDATGWSPAISVDQMLQDMVDAETH